LHLARYAALKRIEAVFYRTASGSEPVRQWLKKLSREDRRTIGVDIMTAEYGWPIGMPTCRKITSREGIWEIRSDLSGNRIARVLFTIAEGRMVLLHGFIKKTQQTEHRELDLAMKRKKDLGV
jgi:phage-related protein